MIQENTNEPLSKTAVMRCLFYSLLTILFMTNSYGQYKKAEKGKTNYKTGFSYYEPGRIDVKVTLIEFHKDRDGRPWKMKVECMGTIVYGWTDDSWIDLYTDKAFLNAQTHQIVYYDEVNIIPKIKQ